MQIKILDFGIAKSQQTTTTTARMQPTAILGTFRYMLPEQAAGAGLAEIDARADLYSLGVVSYEMLTGQPAFAGDSWQSLLAQHLHAQPVPPHEAQLALQIPRRFRR